MPDNTNLKKQFMMLQDTRLSFKKGIIENTANEGHSIYLDRSSNSLVFSNSSREEDGYLFKISNTLNSSKNYSRHNIEVANPN
jgi:hypothetical protein